MVKIFSDIGSWFVNSCRLTSTKVLVVVEGSQYRMYGTILTISENSITNVSAPTAVTDITSTHHSPAMITALSSTKVLLTRKKVNASKSEVLFIVFTISGDTIIKGPDRTLSQYDTLHPHIYHHRLSDTKVLIVFPNSSENYQLYAGIVTISGTSVSTTAPVSISATNMVGTSGTYRDHTYIDIVPVRENTYSVLFANYADGHKLYSILISISGSTINRLNTSKLLDIEAVTYDNNRKHSNIRGTQLSTDRIAIHTGATRYFLSIKYTGNTPVVIYYSLIDVSLSLVGTKLIFLNPHCILIHRNKQLQLVYDY